MRRLCLALLLSLISTLSLAQSQSVPYQGFDCQIYDRICYDSQGDYCIGYYGASSVEGSILQTTFEPIWTPPSIGCLAHFTFCSANPQDPAVGEVWFYYAVAYSPLGVLLECGPVPPAPMSGEACAYIFSEVDYHAH